MGTDYQCSSPLPGGWVKGKVVGSGSFGTVNLAINKATGGLFAVKSTQGAGDGLMSLKNEGNILEDLNSPYVIKCMGKEQNCLFLEYMGGGSLSDVLAKSGGALDEQVIQLYTREILHGLKYLHENGIMHCDLKCKNVLLGCSGNIKLADFGCAKRIKELKRVGISKPFIGGTPLWMSPEVLRNEGLDSAADIWSLGCTIIEMATGKPPWSHEVSNPMAAIYKIACSNERPKYPTQFSKEGLDFLDKCLDRDPQRRWTTEELLNHPFVSIALSPASVLDVGIHEEDCDSDEEESGLMRNPFSTKIIGEGKRKENRKQCDTSFWSSDNWITVRCE